MTGLTLTWRALYKDGTVVDQYDEKRDPIEVSSEVIDRKKVKTFFIMREQVPVLTLHLDEGQNLIYRRRVSITGDEKQICHLAGWQHGVGIGIEIAQSIAYVFEDGTIEMAGKFRENDPWFYPIVLTDKEKAQGLK